MTLAEVSAVIEGALMRQQMAWLGDRRLLHAYISAHSKTPISEEKLWPLPYLDAENDTKASEMSRIIAEMNAEKTR